MKEGRAAVGACLRHTFVDLGIGARQINVRSQVRETFMGAGHYVLAGRKESSDVLDRAHSAVEGPAQRAVTHAVGVQRQDCFDVIGGEDTGRLHPDQLTGVVSDLVGVVDPDTRQLEVGALDDGPQRMLADAASPPLNDAIRHTMSLSLD